MCHFKDFDYVKFCSVIKCEVYHADGFDVKLTEFRLCLTSCTHSFVLLAVVQNLNNAKCYLM